MFDCTTDKYDAIYAPWLQDVRALLNIGGYQSGEKLLDLCGGTGAVCRGGTSRRKSGPEPDLTLLDLNPRCKNPKVRQVEGKAEDVAIHFERDTFDIVVCRQAMGYVEPGFVIPGVYRVLKPGGRFVFSTFVHPRRGSHKRYDHKGNRYVEAHVFAFNRILHLQWRLGTGADLTLFRYYSRAKLGSLLQPWFDFDVHEVGRGLRWVCVKPGKLRAAGG